MIANFMMKKIAKMIADVPRSPILRRPNEYGLEYDDISFQATDGISLEGWYLPAKSAVLKDCCVQSFLSRQSIRICRPPEGMEKRGRV